MPIPAAGAAARASYCRTHKDEPLCTPLTNEDIFVIIGSALGLVLALITITMLFERFFRKKKE
jgi:hypothetical protein